MQSDGRAADSILIVTGPMRSGTTLTGELLGAEGGRVRHPDLAFDNDYSSIIRDMAKVFREASGDSGWQMEDPFIPFRPDAQALRNFIATQPSNTAGLDKLGEVELRKRAAATLQAEVISRTGYRGVPQVIGFKNTHLMREPDSLRLLFKTVRTVIVVRDPRDMLVSSLERNRRAPLAGYLVLATCLGYAALLQHTLTDTVVIQYEHLVADPAGTVRRILQFAGLDPERYDWRAIEEKAVASNSSFGEARGADVMIAGVGVSSASVGRYRLRLSKYQQYCVERLLGDTFMRRFGYEPEMQPDAVLEAEFRRWFAPDLLQLLDEYSISSKTALLRLEELGIKPRAPAPV